MKNYLHALAECIKQASMHGDKAQSSRVAILLELSTEPQAALVYYLTNKRVLTDGIDMMFVQDIEQFLTDGVKQ